MTGEESQHIMGAISEADHYLKNIDQATITAGKLDAGQVYDLKFNTPTSSFTNFLGLIPGRATYVIDKKGVVQLIFDSTSAKIHIEKALEILKTM